MGIKKRACVALALAIICAAGNRTSTKFDAPCREGIEPVGVFAKAPEIKADSLLSHDPIISITRTYYAVPLDRGIQNFIIARCEEYDIDPAIVLAMIEVESQYRADVIGDGGRSYGLMQIQKRFHLERMERLGATDLLDPMQNVSVGIDYLAELLAAYGGNIDMAIVAYNYGSYGANKDLFSNGIYSTKYSRAVFAAAERISETAVTEKIEVICTGGIEYE